MIKVFHDYVVVEREEASDRKTGGGILVKDSKVPDIAVVKNIGFGVNTVILDEMGIDIGSRVVVSQLAGTDLYIGGDTVTVVRIEDIIAKIVDNGKSTQKLSFNVDNEQE